MQWSILGEGEKPNHKKDEKTHDGCFIGIEWPSALILDTGNKIRRISKNKIRTHEAMYCKTPIRSMKQLRELLSQTDTDTANHDEETPSMVQSIQSPRQAK